MVLDICATCGEEHEPPRGSKCNKLPKKLVKSELHSSGEELTGAVTDSGYNPSE